MPGNIAQFFARHLTRPTHAVFRHHVQGAWRDVTVAEVEALARQWQAAFRRDGLVAGDRVAICARNGVNWVAVDLAALGLGLVVVPLYVDDNAENVAWCVGTADARLLIVENSRLAAALAKCAGAALPLPPVVVLRPDDGETAATLATFLPDATVELTVAELADDTLATICFTSGTAGRPKGVMLSHANIIANVGQCAQTGMARPEDVFLSILPLSHMFERSGGYYLPLSLGAKVAFSRGVAQIADDLATQAPTIIFAVPRIFDRFRARIDTSLANSPAKRRLFDACVARGFRVATGRGSALDRLLVPGLRKLIGTPVLARLGGRLRLAVVGGAALDPMLARTFIGLGLGMLQGYGMTEASPVIAVNLDDDNVPESVGPPLPGVEVRLSDGGELLVRGRNVMLGYWKNPAATDATLTADGWLHTGDIAQIDADGYVKIVDRKKELIINAAGKNMSPANIESTIRAYCPLVGSAVAIGDDRPFVVLLAVTQETDEKVLIKRANDKLRDFPRWTRVRRVVMQKEPWSVDNGLLTPTLKLKRPILMKRLAPQIEAAYADSSSAA